MKCRMSRVFISLADQVSIISTEVQKSDMVLALWLRLASFTETDRQRQTERQPM